MMILPRFLTHLLAGVMLLLCLSVTAPEAYSADYYGLNQLDQSYQLVAPSLQPTYRPYASSTNGIYYRDAAPYYRKTTYLCTPIHTYYKSYQSYRSYPISSDFGYDSNSGRVHIWRR